MKSPNSPASASALLRSRVFALFLIGAALLLTSGFAWHSDGHDPSNSSQAAIEHFWQAYHSNDYSQIPQVEEQLQQAIQPRVIPILAIPPSPRTCRMPSSSLARRSILTTTHTTRSATLTTTTCPATWASPRSILAG